MKDIVIQKPVEKKQSFERKVISKHKNGSTRVYTPVDPVTKTDQSFKEECDVNNIIAKFRKTGHISHIAKIQGTYGDFSNVPDLRSAYQTVIDANNAFNDLPAGTRDRFQNDPAKFLDFMSNPKNDDEAIQLGLKTRRSPPSSDPGNPGPKPSDSAVVPSSPPPSHTPKKAPKADKD